MIGVSGSAFCWSAHSPASSALIRCCPSSDLARDRAARVHADDPDLSLSRWSLSVEGATT